MSWHHYGRVCLYLAFLVHHIFNTSASLLKLCTTLTLYFMKSCVRCYDIIMCWPPMVWKILWYVSGQVRREPALGCATCSGLTCIFETFLIFLFLTNYYYFVLVCCFFIILVSSTMCWWLKWQNSWRAAFYHPLLSLRSG